MTEFTISNIEIEDIDILAEKIQTIGHALSIVSADDLGLKCGDLHYEAFAACSRNAEEIRKKLKDIENGSAESAEDRRSHVAE